MSDRMITKKTRKEDILFNVIFTFLPDNTLNLI